MRLAKTGPRDQAGPYSNLRSTRSWWGRTLATLLISFIERRAVMENKVPERSMVTGRVNTQAIAMARIVFSCNPEWLAAMVPATPEDNTWVVLTGKPRRSAPAIVDIATNSAEAPCA